ncbi:glycoside hydrolase domain-containing protein [Alicyclobacillus sp. SO9]|uniref:glycoside hydrolase domain-containing protein n=1 Tax=Alicyclobacillus sp. SO9 TaxID=2665646 RepID=UPI0018E78811|nr:glycoside hydrolase domain-containing protein [Alicyclobacillus sp. SO9]QQE79806.1 DUF1906 domain-containing protein [Alicyclobacillus sp. SO9]
MKRTLPLVAFTAVTTSLVVGCGTSHQPLAGLIASAQASEAGLDADAPLTAPDIHYMLAHGYKFCLRYVSWQSVEKRGDLTHDEAARILKAGLALMPVQHALASSSTGQFHPTGALGTKLGRNAVKHVKNIGFPKRVTIWLDLEGVAASVPVNSIVNFCNHWYDAVSAGGFTPGLYVGYDSGLNKSQLSQLKFHYFWKSGSSVAAPFKTSYQLMQNTVGSIPGGPQFDEDHTTLNAKLLWLERYKD